MLTTSKGKKSEVLDFKNLSLPSRSYLYSLPPILDGTHGTEHLISYTARLAIAHHMKYRDFMRRIVLSRFEQENFSFNFSGIDSKASFFFRQNRAVLSTGTLATELSNIIEDITNQPNINYLTMSSYFSLFSHRNLISKTRKWCPLCFEEMHDDIVYEPLAWTIKSSTICPFHKIKLKTMCDKCKNSSKTMSNHNYPGYCPHCHHWLGNQDQTTQSEEKDNFISDWQYWYSNAIYELLAFNNNPNHKERIGIDHFSKIINRINFELFEGVWAEFGRYTNITRGSIMGWAGKKQTPQIQYFLKIIYCFYPSIREYFADNTKYQILRKPPHIPEDNLEPRKKIPEKTIYHRFLKLMEEDKDGEFSFTMMTHKIGTNRQRFRKSFPKEVEEIKNKNQAYRTRKKKERKDKISKNISDSIKSRLKNNRSISMGSVGNAIGIVFYQQDLIELYEQTVEELRKEGYSF